MTETTAGAVHMSGHACSNMSRHVHCSCVPVQSSLSEMNSVFIFNS
jgi:hypothetical protein